MGTMPHPIDLITIGTSLGGLDALKRVLSPIPWDFPVPILVVRHQPPTCDDYIIKALSECCHLHVQFAKEGERPHPHSVYLAPPDRHLVVGEDRRLHLSQKPKVNYSRPAIDLLFQSASSVYGESVLGVILSGSNHDGRAGVLAVKECGGLVLVQDPKSAEADTMPLEALQAVEADYVAPLDQIGPFLWSLTR